MRGKAFGAGVAALLAGLAVAGCGSSITKAQFLAKANKICTQGTAKLKVDEKRLETEKISSITQVEAFIRDSFVPSVQSQLDAVGALEKPSGEETKIKNILSVAQSELNKVKTDPSAFLSGGAKPFASFAAEAHAYGLDACAAEE